MKDDRKNKYFSGIFRRLKQNSLLTTYQTIEISNECFYAFHGIGISWKLTWAVCSLKHDRQQFFEQSIPKWRLQISQFATFVKKRKAVLSHALTVFSWWCSTVKMPLPSMECFACMDVHAFVNAYDASEYECILYMPVMLVSMNVFCTCVSCLWVWMYCLNACDVC